MLKALNTLMVYLAYFGILVNIFLLVYARMNGHVDGQILAVANMFLLSFVAFKDIK